MTLLQAPQTLKGRGVLQYLYNFNDLEKMGQILEKHQLPRLIWDKLITWIIPYLLKRSQANLGWEGGWLPALTLATPPDCIPTPPHPNLLLLFLPYSYGSELCLPQGLDLSSLPSSSPWLPCASLGHSSALLLTTYLVWRRILPLPEGQSWILLIKFQWVEYR